MKSEFDLYMETGMLGAYQPEMAVLKKVDDGVHPVYRDTVYELCEEGMSGKHGCGRQKIPHHLCIPGRCIFHSYSEVPVLHRQ